LTSPFDNGNMRVDISLSSDEVKESMEVKFVVVGGNSSGKKIAIPGPKFLIGRSEECQLRPKSDLVSRHHAVVLVEEGFAAIRDFGSKNGTFVNGEKIAAEQELKNGDHLKVGPLEFEVELVVEVGGKKKPKVHSIQEAAARTVETAAAPTDDDGDMDVGDRGDAVGSGLYCRAHRLRGRGRIDLPVDSATSGVLWSVFLLGGNRPLEDGLLRLRTHWFPARRGGIGLRSTPGACPGATAGSEDRALR